MALDLATRRHFAPKSASRFLDRGEVCMEGAQLYRQHGFDQPGCGGRVAHGGPVPAQSHRRRDASQRSI